jgi:hypothetical protein
LLEPVHACRTFRGNHGAFAEVKFPVAGAGGQLGAAQAGLAGAHRLLGEFALGDVGIGGDKAALGQRIADDFDDATIGSGADEAMRFEIPGQGHQFAYLGLDVAGAVITALGVVANEGLE